MFHSKKCNNFVTHFVTPYSPTTARLCVTFVTMLHYFIILYIYRVYTKNRGVLQICFLPKFCNNVTFLTRTGLQPLQNIFTL